MSKKTTNLELFEYDPLTDGSLTFNVDDALNDNWDIIDEKYGELSTDNTSLKSKTSITQATLAAGETEITFNDARITTNSIFSFFSSIYGVNPTEVAVEAGKVTLTFEEQEENLIVGVRLDG